MNAIEALEAAGFKYKKDVMDESFDYPLDFIERLSDGAEILCQVTRVQVPNGFVIELKPYILWKNWFVANDSDWMDEFLVDFSNTFEEFWMNIGPKE